MKYSIKIALLSISVLVGLAVCTACSRQCSSESVSVEVCWEYCYDSPSLLCEKAENIITGTVTDTKAELRGNVVFTRIYVEIKESIKGDLKAGDVIYILQTGGSVEGHNTPAIADIPLMNVGDDYLLMVYKTEPSEQYGQYYLIEGGYQGAAQIADDGSLKALASSNSEFVEYFEKEYLEQYITDEVSAEEDASTALDNILATDDKFKDSIILSSDFDGTFRSLLANNEDVAALARNKQAEKVLQERMNQMASDSTAFKARAICKFLLRYITSEK